MVGWPMSCPDRTQPVCLWQLGVLVAWVADCRLPIADCRLPIADGHEGVESPGNTGFLQKSFAYQMGLGYSAQPCREQEKKLFPKGL